MTTNIVRVRLARCGVASRHPRFGGKNLRALRKAMTTMRCTSAPPSSTEARREEEEEEDSLGIDTSYFRCLHHSTDSKYSGRVHIARPLDSGNNTRRDIPSLPKHGRVHSPRRGQVFWPAASANRSQGQRAAILALPSDYPSCYYFSADPQP